MPQHSLGLNSVHAWTPRIAACSCALPSLSVAHLAQRLPGFGDHAPAAKQEEARDLGQRECFDSPKHPQVLQKWDGIGNVDVHMPLVHGVYTGPISDRVESLADLTKRVCEQPGLTIENVRPVTS